MKHITLKDLAKQLGLSTATVSKALKNYPDVSDETKKSVQDLARELNYEPNSFALGLRSKESKIIGVIIPTMIHYFFSSVLDAIFKEAEQRNYMVIVMQSNEEYCNEKKQVDLLLNKGVDGILISLSNKTNDFKHLQKIIDYDIPLVLFDKIAKLVNCSKVFIDDKKAAYEAVSYLISKGYKRIAHFRGDLNPQNSIDRFLGYKKALEDHGITFDPSLVYLCDNNSDFSDGYSSAKQILLDHGDNVDAIFTVNDLMAIGAINYFNEKGIKIPEQIALFGFSNWFMASVITPSLSSIDQNAYQMGKKSIEILFEEILSKKSNKPFTHKKIVIDTELVIRNSC
ncbi:LacI family DNA-binding transcriptional regulator [Tenacibaculum tangerinum]|uniref:LacI family DNA-binding transcriptional regulator n=1 Tax=Tenacibaculum tangerinum TaxID=3038772 RepID=A0ABY8L3T0_9FLAO|nr:LacI family DNA-binding transcriptional regulator [Tenacibaculum tangerinum]WGH76087.1 LacI family DNA-binding transcriptional regulator [Tenacibaculum tangerinum]